MKHFIRLIVSVAGIAVGVGSAGPTAIGTAKSAGQFWIDGTPVWNQATLLPGSQVRASNRIVRLQLAKGVDIGLAPESQVRVYPDELVLVSGSTELVLGRAYRLEAGGLEVSGEAGAQLAVSARGPNVVTVQARQGNAQVRTSQGVLLAMLHPGDSLEFEPGPAGAEPPTTLAGCLTRSGGRYILADPVTRLNVAVEGDGLEQYVGKTVQISGPLVRRTPEGAVLWAAQVVPLSTTCAEDGSRDRRQSRRNGIAGKRVIAGVAIAAAGTGLSLGLVGGQDHRETVSR